MNLSPNFCTKCGNPKNPGEKVCRFCGEPFGDTNNPLSDDCQSSVEESQENPLFEDNTLDNIPCVDKFDLSNEGKHDEGNSAGCVSSNDNTFVEEQHNHKEYCSTKTQDQPCFKVPKKWLYITIISLLVSALIIGVVYLFKMSNSPSKIVRQAFEALKNNDVDSFCDFMNLSKDTKPYFKEISKKTMNFIGDDFDEMEILDEAVEDNKAVVKTMLVYKNGDRKHMELHLTKIQDEWKIEPLGDFGFGLDSLFEFGKQFGVGNSGSLKEDIFNIINDLF
jgi:uncharacterized membrane protein YvbJ